MSDVVIAGLISLVSIIVSAITSLSLVNWRLNALERKVEEHNAWGDKFQEQSTDIALIKQSVEYIKENMK